MRQRYVWDVARCTAGAAWCGSRIHWCGGTLGGPRGAPGVSGRGRHRSGTQRFRGASRRSTQPLAPRHRAPRGPPPHRSGRPRDPREPPGQRPHRVCSSLPVGTVRGRPPPPLHPVKELRRPKTSGDAKFTRGRVCPGGQWKGWRPVVRGGVLWAGGGPGWACWRVECFGRRAARLVGGGFRRPGRGRDGLRGRWKAATGHRDDKDTTGDVHFCPHRGCREIPPEGDQFVL